MKKGKEPRRDTRREDWWLVDEEEAGEVLFSYVRSLEEQMRDRVQQNIRLAKLYSNCELPGIDWTLSSASGGGGLTTRAPRNSVNVVKSVCDTATALIAKNRPKATFVTDGGDFSTQRRAKMLEKFVVGQFQKNDVYNKAVGMFADAVQLGTGALKVFEDESYPCVERVLIDEIIVDEAECRTTGPRSLNHRKFVDKDVLIAQFPDHRKAIEEAHEQQGGRMYTSYRKVESQQVVVVEAWHLRSGPKAKDGRHIIAIENGEPLYYEKYADDDFPFVFFRWRRPIVGFYGQGLAEDLAGKQLRINKLHKFIDDCQDLISVPRVFADHASRVLQAQFTNRIGEVIGYRGRPPIFHNPQAVSAEVYSWLERIVASCYEEVGISRLDAQQKKPAGVESAVALRELTDIASGRFSIQEQNYEEAILSVARRLVTVSKRIYGRTKKLSTVFYDRTFVKRIDWSEVDMEEDLYCMGIEASSLLSRSPAGRLQGVVELAQTGLIKPPVALRLLGHPDLEREMDLENAGIEDIEATIENLLESRFEPPEPFQNLTLGIPRVQMAYLKARRDGAPEEVLEGMRQWMDQAQALLAPPAPPTDAAALEEQAQAMAEAAMPQDPMAMVPPAGVVPGMGPTLPNPGTPDPAFSQQAMAIRAYGQPSV